MSLVLLLSSRAVADEPVFCDCETILFPNHALVPGTTDQLVGLLRNTWPWPCDFTWSISQTAGSLTILFLSATSGSVTLNSASQRIYLDIEIPEVNDATDLATFTLECVSADATFFADATACLIPQDETTVAIGWSAIETAAHEFMGELQPPTTDFSGRRVSESGLTTPGFDECWDISAPWSCLPWEAVTGGVWDVHGPDNIWGPDTIGYRDECALHYATMSYPDGKCQATMPQVMGIECAPGEWIPYTSRRPIGGSVMSPYQACLAGVGSFRHSTRAARCYP